MRGMAHLFDHIVRVWRQSTTLGELREEQRALVPRELATAPNAAVRRPRSPLSNPGPGLAPVGERIVYMAADADVQSRDVLELVEGPDAPGLLEVDEPPTHPRGHHTEIRCRIFNGVLPTEGS
jgi:hypothetical protein